MTPEYVTWERKGKSHTQITPACKYTLLRETAGRIGARTFVETGTDSGTTIEIFRHLVPQVYSIELDPVSYLNARRRFVNCPEVTLLHGDSGELLPQILPKLEEPVLFWLDAHTADYEGPIEKELDTILASGISGVILIDDMDYLPNPPRRPGMKLEHGIAKILLGGLQ